MNAEIMKNFLNSMFDSIEKNKIHYQDGIIDIWKVTFHGKSCYFDNEIDATYAATEQYDPLDDVGTIIKETIHREVFEHLPEFDGF